MICWQFIIKMVELTCSLIRIFIKIQPISGFSLLYMKFLSKIVSFKKFSGPDPDKDLFKKNLLNYGNTMLCYALGVGFERGYGTETLFIASLIH